MAITPDQLDKLLPKLADAKLEAELHRVIRRIYEYIDLLSNHIVLSLEAKIKNGDLTSEDLTGLIGVFSQPLAGSNISDPLLQAVLQTYGIQADHVFFAGPTPSFRAIELADLPAIPAGIAVQLDADGTILDINTITDGELIKRTGATIIGAGTSTTPQFARLGIGVAAPTGDKFLQVTDNNVTNTTEIGVTNAGATGNVAGAIYRATADVCQIQFACWASSRTTVRFGVTVGGWAELINVAGNGIIYGTFNNTPVIFGQNSVARMRLDAGNGNLKLAGTATRATTEGTNHLDIFNGTAPVGTLANGISLYSTAGELRSMDAGGTATLLSQHSEDAPDWFYDDEITTPNVSMESNCFSGIVRFINFTRQARLQQLLLDGKALPNVVEKRKIIHEEIFDEYNSRLNLALDNPKFLVMADWDENQDHMVKEQDEAIVNWHELKRLSIEERIDWNNRKNSFEPTEEKPIFDVEEPIEFREPIPQKHIKQPKPKWLKVKK